MFKPSSHKKPTYALRFTLLVSVLFWANVSLGQTSYNEAPQLAEQVAAGELPPVEERLPENPLVIDVVEEIGQYGGVLRRAFLGPADANNYVRVVYDSLVRFSPDGSEITPRLVESWEASDDFSSWTLHLRSGARWSDGEPFTADAIMFWYEDVILNEDLTPSTPSWLQNSDGSPALVERVDDDTVTFTYDQPNTLFLTELTFRDGGDRTLAAFLPAHYLKQFHPSYVDEAELQAEVRRAGFETWPELFMTRAMPTENPARPTMAAWVPHNSTVSDQNFVLRRNPYYIAVDPEGNQLPYIDEVHFRFFSDIEALNFAAVTGEFDFQARHIQMTNYPVLVENEERGNYHVLTWPTFGGSDAAIHINQNYLVDPEIGELLANRDFRIALSHAINRDEIRESAFLGLGEIRQPVPAPWHPYYPGDEYAQQYTEFDPERANEILDELGLARDASGMRMLPSGRPLRLELAVVPAFGPWVDVAQLTAADWNAVGLQVDVQVRERTAHFTMRDNNELMMEVWNEDTTGFPFTGNPKVDPRSTTATIFAVENRRWYATDGAQGLEPTESIKRIVELVDRARTVGPEGQIEVAQELYQHTSSELFAIGTVGLTPMIQGVVVVNDNLRNVPDTAGNDWPLRTPGNAQPEQFFFER